MCEKLNKKKGTNVKPFMVKNHLWVFANAQIVNPAFDSQARGARGAAPGRARALRPQPRRSPGPRHNDPLCGALLAGPARPPLPLCPSAPLPHALLAHPTPPHPTPHPPTTCHPRVPPHRPQTKETLTTKASSFGSKCELTPALLEKISK
jgi:hypothetical protein